MVFITNVIIYETILLDMFYTGGLIRNNLINYSDMVPILEGLTT